MNLGILLGNISLVTTLLGGAVGYAIGHIKGSKAQAAAAPTISALETKINNAMNLATAAKALVDTHAVQLPLINQAVGGAASTAQTALDTLTAKGLPPSLAQAIDDLGAQALDKVRQGAENIATQTLSSVSKSMENINLTGSLRLGGADVVSAPLVPPPPTLPAEGVQS